MRQSSPPRSKSSPCSLVRSYPPWRRELQNTGKPVQYGHDAGIWTDLHETKLWTHKGISIPFSTGNIRNRTLNNSNPCLLAFCWSAPMFVENIPTKMVVCAKMVSWVLPDSVLNRSINAILNYLCYIPSGYRIPLLT